MQGMGSEDRYLLSDVRSRVTCACGMRDDGLRLPSTWERDEQMIDTPRACVCAYCINYVKDLSKMEKRNPKLANSLYFDAPDARVSSSHRVGVPIEVGSPLHALASSLASLAS